MKSGRWSKLGWHGCLLAAAVWAFDCSGDDSGTTTGRPGAWATGAMFVGGNHNSTPGQAKSSEAYIGFLRWRLMGDTAGHDMLVGSTCKICSDTAFGEVAKTTSWDSL